ncbi:MAG TPA: hypothetical protein VG324_20995, partial [Blastocatellia bacterium]|nr:hypothetical protein [Blastocatellia bacterium]
MRVTITSACFGILALFAFASQAHAERWVQINPEDQHLWYDADSVRPTPNGLITVWMSAGPT